MPAPGSARPSWRELLAVAGLMVVLTLVMLYPYVRHMGWVPELGDPLFSILRIGWVAHQLKADPFHLYDANIFWPERYGLAYSDGMPLTGIAAAPFVWLGVSPAVIHNVFVLASFVLSGLTMYLLVRSLVASRLAAIVSAVAYAFYPWRFEHLIHIELLSAFWMPLALWAFHQTLTDPTRRMRMGILTGAAVAAQYLSGMYFGVFLVSFLFVVWATLVVARAFSMDAVKPLVAGSLLAVALIVPVLPPYIHVRQAAGERTVYELDLFSAQPKDYLLVHQPNPRKGGCNERQVFPGFLIVALALVALWPPLSAVRVAYLVGLAFMFDISLGSNGILHPFLYQWVLPFRGLRAPARCTILVGLSLSVLAGYGTARLTGLLRDRRWRIGLVAVLCGVILAEPRPARGITPVPEVPPVYAWFKGRPVRPIAEIPFWWGIADRYVFYSTFHWLPLANGFSGSWPPSYRPLHVAMRTFPDPNSITTLRAYGVWYAVIHEEFYGTASYRDMIERIESTPALSLVNVATDGRFEARIYRVTGRGP